MSLVVGYLSDQAWVPVIVVAFVAPALVAAALLSGVLPFRQRTLWIAFALVLIASTALWDGIELRFEEGTSAFYFRTDWDWEGGGGGVTEWISYAALFAGSALAAGLAYSAVVQAGFRRLSRRRSRILLAATALPLGAALGVGLFIAIFAHPYLLFPQRTS